MLKRSDQRRSVVQEFIQIAKPFWVSQEGWMAFGLLVLIMGLSMISVYYAVIANRWDGEVFDAIGKFDQDATIKALMKGPWILGLYIGVKTFQKYLTNLLGIRWRRWLTNNLVEKYVKDGTFYFLQLTESKIDNPDQRITEDVRDFIDKTLLLSIEIFTQLVIFISFVAILWNIAGSFRFNLFGMAIEIPGYMVWFCFLFSGLGSWISHLLGRKLIKLDYDQQRYEADFRYDLVRMRENSESIVMNAGGEFEKRSLKNHFQSIYKNFIDIIGQKKNLSFFTLIFDQRTSGISSMVLTLPKFFSKEMDFGTFMRVPNTFFKVRNSLAFFVNSYAELALWRSIVLRLTEFRESIEQAKQLKMTAESNLNRVSNQNGIQLKDLSVYLPGQQKLIQSLTEKFLVGVPALISGPSGYGKSTLFKVISGNWPFTTGKIEIPQGARFLFLPQKPYIPVGALKDAFTYPLQDFESDQLEKYLSLCELEHLRPRLNDVENWAQILSPGEQQRGAFVRAFVYQPDWLFLDEATSALDERLQTQLYEAIPKLLPNTTVVSIAHRLTLEKFHQKTLTLTK